MINVRKSHPAPDCLAKEKEKQRGTYDCGEVRTRLVADFFNKCYICEQRAVSSLDIEHFISHRGNVDLKFDWYNLFLSCSHCNSCKQHLYDDILKCTDFSTIITNCISFEINPFPKENPQIKALTSEVSVNRTVELLNKVFNGNTIKQQIEADNIRESLIKEVWKFCKLLRKYYKPGLAQNERSKMRMEIQCMLSPETAFTAFKIWVIKRNPKLMDEFEDLLPVF